MKVIKVIPAVTAIVFAGLGLLKILPFEIANPIMLASLATLFILRSIEYKKRGDKNGFILTFIVAIFSYAIVIYRLIIG